VSKRNLFVSFAESDGGHSYLAMREMLDADSIGHLLFRTTVADVLDTVIAGQANYAVVPFYNSITQWDGATLKALASGQFEIHAQMCMPVSYVLAAHKQYMNEFVERYRALSPRDDGKTELSPERAKKIYTRFLTRIFVNAQAEEQYRGRLIRPDMAQATLEHTRNPLRVLEEISRNELMKDLQWGAPRHGRPQREQGYGGTPLYVDLAGARPGTISELNVPAVLIAAGLLDGRQDSDGWDRHGSVGEILSLLKNLLELLDVYSFGAPDMPENKTKYLLLSKRGTGKPPSEALLHPSETAQSRTMVLVQTKHAAASGERWRRPLKRLESDAAETDFRFEQAPIPVEGTGKAVFLFEGGQGETCVLQSLWNWKKWFPWATSGGSLQERIEKKPRNKPEKNSPDDYSLIFLGEYKSWCSQSSGHAGPCSCTNAKDPKSSHKDSFFSTYGLLLTTLLLASALVVTLMLWRPWDAADLDLSQPPIQSPDGPGQGRLSPQPSPNPGLTGQVPGNDNARKLRDVAPSEAEPPSSAQPTPPYPPPPEAAFVGQRETLTAKPATGPVPSHSEQGQPQPLVLHVAFSEAKANLTRESFNALASAAAQALQASREVRIRVFALGQRETDTFLWNRRLTAVKDELVRLGVPVARIRSEGQGPFMVLIKQEPSIPSARRETQPEPSMDSTALDDPFAYE
jgi:outer membrane protein OmpA-like peptidoglycan-associated protein